MMFGLVRRVSFLSAALLLAASAHAESVGNFYQKSDDSAVFLQSSHNTYCHVATPQQLDLFGGAGQIIRQRWIHMVGNFTGECGWPNGFYRRSNQPHIYRLAGERGEVPVLGDRICHVANPRQMERFGGFGQVIVVPPDANLETGRGRGSIRECQGR